MECVSLHTGSYFCETQLTSAGCVKIKKRNLPQNYVPRSRMLAKQLKISDVAESLLHTDAGQTELENAFYTYCL